MIIEMFLGGGGRGEGGENIANFELISEVMALMKTTSKIEKT